MDSLHVVVVASPFANLASLYEVDPDADALLIVPPSKKTLDESNGLTINNLDGKRPNPTAASVSSGPSIPGLHIKVSTKHLTLASRVFKTKLQFGSSGAVRQSDRRVHLRLAEGFDAKAVSIVMNVIHGRSSKVPRSVDLATLANIALFVDKFQLLDAVGIYAERWISNLEAAYGLLNAHNRDLLLWIYVSYVFRHAEIFKSVTRIAALHSQGEIRDLELPIKHKIIKHIDTQRQDLLTRTLDIVHQTLDDLASSSSSDSNSSVVPCAKHHCDSLLLGELIKSLHRHRLVWPRPTKPFPNINFTSVIEAVRDGVGLHRQRWQQPDMDHHGPLGLGQPWGGPAAAKGVNGVHKGTAAGVESVSPAWAKVGGMAPVTPEASPEPVLRTGGFEWHDCGASKAVARLEGLERLADGVPGLVLESSLGYQLY